MQIAVSGCSDCCRDLKFPSKAKQKGSKNHTVEWKLVELEFVKCIARRCVASATTICPLCCAKQTPGPPGGGPWFIVGTVRSVRVCKFGIFGLMLKHVWARKVGDTMYIYIFLYLDPPNLQKKAACDFKARVCNENLGF